MKRETGIVLNGSHSMSEMGSLAYIKQTPVWFLISFPPLHLHSLCLCMSHRGCHKDHNGSAHFSGKETHRVGEWLCSGANAHCEDYASDAILPRCSTGLTIVDRVCPPLTTSPTVTQLKKNLCRVMSYTFWWCT